MQVICFPKYPYQMCIQKTTMIPWRSRVILTGYLRIAKFCATKIGNLGTIKCYSRYTVLVPSTHEGRDSRIKIKIENAMTSSCDHAYHFTSLSLDE